MTFPVAILLALTALLAALGFTFTAPPLWSSEIAHDCYQVGLFPDQCNQAALAIGTQSSVTFALSGILILLGAHWWSRRHAVKQGGLPPVSVSAAMAGSALLILAHLVGRHFGQLHASRIEEISSYSTFISLENLLWPLLLQIGVIETDMRRRLGVIGLLVCIMALTPYRTALLTILLFGFAVPMAETLWAARREGWPRARLRMAAALGGLALLLSAGALWSVYVDRIMADSPTLQTQIQRMNQLITSEWRRGKQLPENLQSRREALQRTKSVPLVKMTLPPPVQTEMTEAQANQVMSLPPAMRSLAQRVTIPIFQAVELRQLALNGPLPGILDEIANKLRLSDALSLNEFLYQKMYGGGGTGQTTSLYYGEAIAYFPYFPLAWMILAPLMIGFVWVMFRTRLIDAPVLFAVALWRSSVAGLVTILPSLILQSAALAAMVLLGRRLARLPGFEPAINWCRNGAFVSLAVVLGLHAWETQVRNHILNLAIASPRPECWLTSLSAGTPDLNQVMESHGIHSRGYAGGGLSFYRKRPVLSLIQIPEGNRIAESRPELLASLKPLVDCIDGVDLPEPLVVTEWTVPLNGSVPLLITALGLLVASLWRRPRFRA